MKMKKKTILLSMLALSIFTGCQQDAPKEIDNPQGKELLNIEMELGTYGNSKSVGTPYEASPVTVGTSFIVKSYTGSDLQGTNHVNFTKTGAVYTAVTPISAAATTVSLTGNYDGTIVGGVTLSADANTRQGDFNQPVVEVSGTGTISGDPKIANVNVTPEMARIEITPGYPAFTESTKPSNMRNVTIGAIFINNTKVLRSGTVDRTASNDFATAYAPSGNKYMLYDFISSGELRSSFTRSSPPVIPPIVIGWPVIDGASDAITGAFLAKAVGYNIFPQVGGTTSAVSRANHPHIIVLISYQEQTSPGIWDSKTGYLNITAFKNGSNYITDFVAGSVYTFSLGSVVDLIIDPNTRITTSPDPQTGDVTINCTVSDWVMVPVTPEA